MAARFKVNSQGRQRIAAWVAARERAQGTRDHSWYFNFAWQGQSYRLSLDRHTGEHVAGRGEAEALADTLRASIRAGTFVARQALDATTSEPAAPLTFRAFADDWAKRRGYQLVRSRDNDYRLKRIHEFELPGSSPPTMFGNKPAAEITTGDIEAYRHLNRPGIVGDLFLGRTGSMGRPSRFSSRSVVGPLMVCLACGSAEPRGSMPPSRPLKET